MTDESNPPSPSTGVQMKLDDQEKKFIEAAAMREATFKDQLDLLTKEFLESLDHKENLITELR